jgi:hypothetical protein
MPRLPTFFVAGAGKAGTTSLHSYLAQHPDIFMSPVKEPCFFADEIRCGHRSKSFEKHVRDRIPSDLAGYLGLFENVRDEKAIGESSAAYLWSETAAANIHASVPGAKIILILRDPAERAFSQYLHQLSVGLTKSSFREHLDRCLHADRTPLSIYHPFLEAGLYSAQVQRFLDHFPRQQIRIYWYEEAWRDHCALFRDLFEFLGVDPDFQPDTSQRILERRSPRAVGAHYWLKRMNLWYPLRSLVPESLRMRMGAAFFRKGKALQMDASARQFLIDYYRGDILKLATKLDRDLSSWLI